MNEAGEWLTLIVPFPPGGSTHLTSRVLAGQLSSRRGLVVRVETHVGRYGIEAMQRLLAAGGTAAMIGTINTCSIAPVLHRRVMPFDFWTEIAPVSRLAEFPGIVAAPPTADADTLHDHLAMLAAAGGRLRYSTDFLGTNVDVDMLSLARAAGLRPAYRSTSGALEILADLESRRIDLCILNVATMSANPGRYRPLAITSQQRVDPFPGVPTLEELGFRGAGTSNWQGVFAARRQGDGSWLNDIHRLVVTAMETPEAAREMAAVGAQVAVSGGPEVFASEIRDEMERWRELEGELLGLEKL